MLTSASANMQNQTLSIVLDKAHAEIMNLFFGEVEPIKYDDPIFIFDVQNRALEAIRELLGKVNIDSLFTENTNRPFDLYHEFIRITMNSKRDKSGFYIKAHGVGRELGLNLLEYAILTGGISLVGTFVGLGVTSNNLDKLNENLLNIYNHINNPQSKKMIESFMLAASKSVPQEINDLIIHDDCSTKTSIFWHNHKDAMAMLCGLAATGIILILVAVYSLSSNAPAYGTLMTIGGGLIGAAIANFVVRLVNASREDNLSKIKLHKQSLCGIADFVNTLSIVENGALCTKILSQDGNNLIFSQPKTPTLPLPPKAKLTGISSQRRELMFTPEENREGLNTNSDTTSNRNLGTNEAPLRTWDRLVAIV